MSGVKRTEDGESAGGYNTAAALFPDIEIFINYVTSAEG